MSDHEWHYYIALSFSFQRKKEFLKLVENYQSYSHFSKITQISYVYNLSNKYKNIQLELFQLSCINLVKMEDHITPDGKYNVDVMHIHQ